MKKMSEMSKHRTQLLGLETLPSLPSSHDSSEEVEETLCILDGLYRTNFMLQEIKLKIA